MQKYEENQESSKVNLGGKGNVKLVAGDTNSHLKNKLDKLTKEL